MLRLRTQRNAWLEAPGGDVNCHPFNDTHGVERNAGFGYSSQKLKKTAYSDTSIGMSPIPATVVLLDGE